ncbi:MAG: hypothetical protein GWN58_66985, partial [Anaerolineae bacterium]|nr:hypothetical protein [Anaerolineae bacterium]
FGITLLLGLVFFLARVAWRAVLMGPASESPRPWAFFGTIWLVIYLAMFLYAVNTDFATLPPWYFAAFAHAGFVGMMTNVLLGVLAVRSGSGSAIWSWGEPTALWLMNLGLILFVALKMAADTRLGAIVMGLGVVLG